MTNHTLEAVTLALSEGRKTDVLPQLNLYWKNLGKPQVRSLDDIETEHANKGVSSILNIPKGTPQKLREALSRAGVLPTEMGHYTGGEREYVAERILTRLSTPGVRSHYFWHVDEATLKENQQHLAKTAAFKRFLKDNGIETLDDIAGDSFPNAFTILFGISHHGARKLRKKLAEYGAFSICLEDYTPEQLESVVRRIVETKFRGKNKNVNSFYFFDVSDPDTLEKNRACFVRTASFQEYLTTAGIVSPLDITEAVTESEGIDCLTTIVGCKVGSQQGLRKRLVELGTISDRLGARVAPEPCGL